MFQVIKQMQNFKPKIPLLIETGKGKLTANEHEQCKLIKEHFNKIFTKEGTEVRRFEPTPMEIPFTSKR